MAIENKYCVGVCRNQWEKKVLRGCKLRRRKYNQCVGVKRDQSKTSIACGLRVRF